MQGPPPPRRRLGNPGSHLSLLVVVAGERVGQRLQRGVGVAGQGRHGRDQDHALRQADDQRGRREAGHAAQVDPPRAKMADQAAHDQREKGGGGALQEQAEAAHPDACKRNRNKRLNPAVLHHFLFPNGD